MAEKALSSSLGHSKVATGVKRWVAGPHHAVVGRSRESATCVLPASPCPTKTPGNRGRSGE